MLPDVQLFACICIENELIPAERLREAAAALGPTCDLGTFAQYFIDHDICTDYPQLQFTVDQALDLFEQGETASFDPFAPKKLALKLVKEPAVGAPVSGAQPPPVAPPPEPRTESAAQPRPVPELASVAGTLPSALPDFSAWAGLDDGALRQSLVDFLRYATREGVSDVHLSAGSRPFFRRNRRVQYLSPLVLDPELARRLNSALLDADELKVFVHKQDYDLAMAFPTGERYRVNLMVHKEGMAGTYRTISDRIPSLEELGFLDEQTAVIRKMLTYHNGLILVTGPVGAGKTTTLATLVDEINRTREDHIITVEQPIEIVHRADKCCLTQRGVGAHTHSFHSALKGALRQDPDIIVIGEMRDLETIEMAISASETGHLVIGTLHTFDAATTLNRILDVFPPAQQTQIRAMVAESLRGIICQRLIPDKKGGLALAVELLVRTSAIANLTREGKSEGLGNIIETGKRDGMVRMDVSIMNLWKNGRISDDTAVSHLQNRVFREQILKQA